MQRLYKL